VALRSRVGWGWESVGGKSLRRRRVDLKPGNAEPFPPPTLPFPPPGGRVQDPGAAKKRDSRDIYSRDKARHSAPFYPSFAEDGCLRSPPGRARRHTDGMKGLDHNGRGRCSLVEHGVGVGRGDRSRPPQGHLELSPTVDAAIAIHPPGLPQGAREAEARLPSSPLAGRGTASGGLLPAIAGSCPSTPFDAVEGQETRPRGPLIQSPPDRREDGKAIASPNALESQGKNFSPRPSPPLPHNHLVPSHGEGARPATLRRRDGGRTGTGARGLLARSGTGLLPCPPVGGFAG